MDLAEVGINKIPVWPSDFAGEGTVAVLEIGHELVSVQAFR